MLEEEGAMFLNNKAQGYRGHNSNSARNSTEIMVVAGEVSGDLYAARVVREIKNLVADQETANSSPRISFTGMGRNRLAQAGQRQDIRAGRGDIGLSGGLAGLKKHWQWAKKLASQAQESKPAAALLVDYSGFNMYLGRRLRKIGIPVIHYIPPSAWLWGQWRAKWLARYDIQVAAIFPQEEDCYQRAGARSHFVGHPLLDEIPEPRKQRAARESLNDYLKMAGRQELDPGARVLALLPGSREKEIATLIEPLLQAARRLSKKFCLQVIIPQDSDRDITQLADLAGKVLSRIEVLPNRTREVLAASDLALVASGTASLEAALLNCPQIVVYQVGRPTALVGKLLLKTDWISLPNIIAGAEIVPELLQDKVKGDIIYKEAKKILQDPELIKEQLAGYRTIREKLGEPGAARRTAELVIQAAGLDNF